MTLYVSLQSDLPVSVPSFGGRSPQALFRAFQQAAAEGQLVVFIQVAGADEDRARALCDAMADAAERALGEGV